MLRQGRYKYVHFAEDHPPLLYDLESDPRELHDLADDPVHATALADLRASLYAIMDPEAVNRQAFEDQARMIESLGGIEAIRALPGFNHTPLNE